MATPLFNSNHNNNSSSNKHNKTTTIIELEDYLRHLLCQEENINSCTEDAGMSDKRDGKEENEQGALSPIVKKQQIWKQKICEWFFIVVDHFEIDREVVSIATTYLDNKGVLSDVMKQSSSELFSAKGYQLLATACLYTAVNRHGVVEDAEGRRNKKMIHIDTFVELSHGVFPAAAIEKMACRLLPTLEREHLLDPATPAKFMWSMLLLLPRWSSRNSHNRGYAPYKRVAFGIFDTARYLTELILMAGGTTEEKNSIVAYVSIMYAIDTLQGALPLPLAEKECFCHTLETITGYTPEMAQARQTKQLLVELCPSLAESGVLLQLIPPVNEPASYHNNQGITSAISVGCNNESSIHPNDYEPHSSLLYPERRSE